ncbi:MAG: hypothetical protein MUO97_01205, partial [Dehalococcoidia bacterium]|nr:hypothetical protein [Dehalococcoidia bacterium]
YFIRMFQILYRYKRSNVDWLLEELSQRIKRFGVNPALDSLSTPFHFYQTCSVKFLNVVRNC